MQEKLVDDFYKEFITVYDDFIEQGLDYYNLLDMVLAVLMGEHLRATDGDLKTTVEHMAAHFNSIALQFQKRCNPENRVTVH